MTGGDVSVEMTGGDVSVEMTGGDVDVREISQNQLETVLGGGLGEFDGFGPAVAAHSSVAGLNFTSVYSSELSSKTASTGMSIRASSISHSTRLDGIRGPSLS